VPHLTGAATEKTPHGDPMRQKLYVGTFHAAQSLMSEACIYYIISPQKSKQYKMETAQVFSKSVKSIVYNYR
jgi:hypothetical protein